ncbi:MAG TPA: AAA family ATPase, partial [Thermoanaerobaculia bacterium]
MSGLPVELTCFVGRERELGEARALLGRTRLLTLTGAGGSGKTRLAVELASRAAGDYPGGAAWVELGPLADPALLAAHVAAALGLREEPGKCPLEALLAHLRERSLLLVLDNCEHLVDACAALADALLRGCPSLSVLTTSREALGVRGERPWLVPPLSLPPDGPAAAPEEVARSEAVQLFVDRARAALPAFDLTAANAPAVAQVCRRLDGIPLAIELAAARVRVLAPEQIAARLDDAFRLLVAAGRTVVPRHRTLRETIEWSYRLLSEEEQILLQRLSVFAGTFPLEAAEVVCSCPPIDGEDVLDLLASLVDKSMVAMELRQGEARYRLLETVRQFAGQHLEGTDKLEPLRARHASWYAAFAEEAEPRIFGGANDTVWLARLEEEEGNLRAALDWSETEPARAATALRLGAALHWGWFAWGRFQEGRDRLARALATGADVPPRVRARASTAYGTATLWQGDLEASRAPMEEAVAIWRGIEDRPQDRPHRAYALAGLGASAALRGELERASGLMDESWAIVQGLEPAVLTAFVLYWRGMTALLGEDWGRARTSMEESVAVGRALGSIPAAAHPLTALGRLALVEGEAGRAAEHLAEALELHRSVGDLWGGVQTLEGIAALALGAGRTERAVRLLGGIDAIRDGIGTPLPSPAQEAMVRLAEAARAAAGEEAFARWWADGRALSEAAAFDLAREEAREAVAAGRPVLVEEPPAAPVEPPPDPADEPPDCESCDLEIRALGPFEVRLQGCCPLARPVGRTSELLAYLLCHPEGRTKDQVGAALWPEASPAQVRNLFHVTLHRLRKT